MDRGESTALSKALRVARVQDGAGLRPGGLTQRLETQRQAAALRLSMAAQSAALPAPSTHHVGLLL